MNKEVYNLAQKVKATNIQEVVDDPEWQELRIWLKGKWANRGKECVERLRNYFEKDKTNPWRVRRLLNYVTCSGFRTGAIKETSVDPLREEIRKVWAFLLGDKATHKKGGIL
jgi:hypothetical protein